MYRFSCSQQYSASAQDTRKTIRFNSNAYIFLDISLNEFMFTKVSAHLNCGNFFVYKQRKKERERETERETEREREIIKCNSFCAKSSRDTILRVSLESTPLLQFRPCSRVSSDGFNCIYTILDIIFWTILFCM